MRQVEAGRPVVSEARALRLTLGLKSMDALHLASAVMGRADAFLTNDDDLVAVGAHRGVAIRPAGLAWRLAARLRGLRGARQASVCPSDGCGL